MSRSMWISATGLMAQQLNLDVIANNLANVNTGGFKKSRADFQDLMYQHIVNGALASGQQMAPVPIQVGLGVRSTGTPKIYTQGIMNSTNQQLDIAIEGDGFFQVQMPNGELGYTRSGNFQMNADGYLTTTDGFMLEPAIEIPKDMASLHVAADGKVLVTRQGQSQQEELGSIVLAKFTNPVGLSNIGRNLLTRTEAAGDLKVTPPGTDGAGTLAQGYLEGSNVDVAEEMIKMIVAQRTYELNSKAIQASDEMQQMTNNLRR